MTAVRKSASTFNVPRHLRGYVDVLGADLAVQFFLAFGGSVVYLAADRPQARSLISSILSPSQIRALANMTNGDKWVRVPTAKPFIACHLRAGGMAVADIARKLHVADWSVRRWTNKDEDCLPSSAPRQTSLFD